MSVTVGVDIGQQQDPTAIVVVDSYRADQERRHRIRWIERVPLGTLYSMVVERIAIVTEAARPFGHVMVVLDATGVGRPVWDMLRGQTSASVRGVVFTSGDKETKPEFNVHRVPKRDIVTSLEVVLQSRRLEVVPDCPSQDDLDAELAHFDFGISATTGHDTYEARGGHDDLVMALGLALWWAERPSATDAGLQAMREIARRTPEQQEAAAAASRRRLGFDQQ